MIMGIFEQFVLYFVLNGSNIWALGEETKR